MTQMLAWAEWEPNEELVCGGKFKLIPLTKAPKLVWTLFREQDFSKPPALPIVPVHHDNAFMEDRTHDWTWRPNFLKYFTRAMDCSCWLLLEFE